MLLFEAERKRTSIDFLLGMFKPLRSLTSAAAAFHSKICVTIQLSLETNAIRPYDENMFTYRQMHTDGN